MMSTRSDSSRYDPKDLKELMTYCKIIIQSSLCPRHIKTPADAMFIIQRGAELGLSAVSSLQNLIVIQGKVTMPAATAVGIAKASPECEYFRRIKTTLEGSMWETKRKGSEPVRYAFTQEDAKTAGLWGSGTWKKYPKNLLDARASMNLARLEYQDILAGVYTPEEMESVAGEPQSAPVGPDGAEMDEAADLLPECGVCGEGVLESSLVRIRHPDAPNPMHKECAKEWEKPHKEAVQKAVKESGVLDEGDGEGIEIHDD